MFTFPSVTSCDGGAHIINHHRIVFFLLLLLYLKIGIEAGFAWLSVLFLLLIQCSMVWCFSKWRVKMQTAFKMIILDCPVSRALSYLFTWLKFHGANIKLLTCHNLMIPISFSNLSFYARTLSLSLYPSFLLLLKLKIPPSSKMHFNWVESE